MLPNAHRSIAALKLFTRLIIFNVFRRGFIHFFFLQTDRPLRPWDNVNNAAV